MRCEIANVNDVAQWRLCCGCGACAFVAPDTVDIVDTFGYGRRPVLKDTVNGRSAADTLAVCPGIGLRRASIRQSPGAILEMYAAWGPVLGIFEGHATDPEIRFKAASGGLATALALYGLEHIGMQGVLHVGARPEMPYLNETIFSRTREELFRGLGSRYSPASPCDGLQRIADAPGPCAFIGKPCDVAGVQQSMVVRPALKEKVGLTIGIFCAGAPTTEGTVELLRSVGVARLAEVTGISYRGNGWPGELVVNYASGSEVKTASTSYEKAWGGVLAGHRPWRCHVCADHAGEFADVAVGDAWHCDRSEAEPGRSLILARTRRGLQTLEDASQAGYISMRPTEPSVMQIAQKGLYKAHAAVWGRVFALRAMGVPAPRFRGYPLFRLWLAVLTPAEKLRSLLGTLRRIFRRRLDRRVQVVPFEARERRPALPHAAGHL